MLCPKCKKNEAINHPTYGIMPCKPCQDAQPTLKGRKQYRFSNINKLHRVQKQQDGHVADLEQPFIGDKPNPEFAKLYPDLAQDYFRKEELEKL